MAKPSSSNSRFCVLILSISTVAWFYLMHRRLGICRQLLYSFVTMATLISFIQYRNLTRTCSEAFGIDKMASTGIDWVKVYSGYSDRLRETPGEKGTFEGVGVAASLGGGGGAWKREKTGCWWSIQDSVGKVEAT